MIKCSIEAVAEEFPLYIWCIEFVEYIPLLKSKFVLVTIKCKFLFVPNNTY